MGLTSGLVGEWVKSEYLGQAPQSQPAPLPTPAMQDAEGRTQRDGHTTQLVTRLADITDGRLGSPVQRSPAAQRPRSQPPEQNIPRGATELRHLCDFLSEGTTELTTHTPGWKSRQAPHLWRLPRSLSSVVANSRRVESRPDAPAHNAPWRQALSQWKPSGFRA